MKDRTIFKVTDYIEHDLEWEERECKKLGVDFSYYQLKDASPDEIIKNVGDADIVLVNIYHYPYPKHHTSKVDQLQ